MATRTAAGAPILTAEGLAARGAATSLWSESWRRFRRHRLAAVGSIIIGTMVLAITFVYSILVVLFNIVADIVYGWLDPRISYA